MKIRTVTRFAFRCAAAAIIVGAACGPLSAQAVPTQPYADGPRIAADTRPAADRRLQALERAAASGDADAKGTALRHLAEMLDNGEISTDDERAFAIAKSLAYEENRRGVRSGNGVPADHPLVRMQACRILGRLGGGRARRVLTDVLLQDAEPIVLAEAVHQISLIGVTEPEILQAIARRMVTRDLIAPDANFTVAALHAIERIVERNENLKDPEVFRAVLHIAGSGYPHNIREKALDVLNDLRRDRD